MTTTPTSITIPDFGAFLERELDLQGHNAYRFSQLTGISRQQLSGLLTGQTTIPTIPTLIKIAYGLGYTPDKFLRKFLSA